MNPKAKLEYYRRNREAFFAEQLKLKSHIPGQLLPFVMNDGQRIIYDRVVAQQKELGYIRYVSLKGRQLGESTLGQGFCYHSTITTPYFSSLLIANDDPSTQKIFGISHTFLTYMDAMLQPMTRHSNKRELVFENPDKRKRSADPGLGSRMDFQASTSIMAGTGTTRHAIHLSEESKWDPESIDLLKSSILPALHPVPGTILIEESTAYVGGDHFRERCEMARSGKSSLVWAFIPWWLDTKNSIPLAPGEKLKLDRAEKEMAKIAARGQAKDQVPPHEITMGQFKWRRHRLVEDEITEAMFEQEYPTTFERAWIKLDATVFDHALLAKVKSSVRPPKRFVAIEPGPKVFTVKGEDGRRDVVSDKDYIAIWKEPEKGVEYDIGVDVAVGSQEANDWSVAEVLRRDTREQVCEVHVHMDPKDLGTLIYWLGKFYHGPSQPAQLIVEMNGPGFATHGQISSMAYPYIYIWRHRERDVPTHSTYRGWKTQHDSKQLMLSNTAHRFNHGELEVHSRVLWDEMYEYVQIAPGIFRASTGNDDAVTALMIAVQGGEDETFGDDADTARSQSVEQRAGGTPDVSLRDDIFVPKMDRSLDAMVQEIRGV